MKKFALALYVALLAPIASADCVGTGIYRTCTDNSGNTYDVQRIGNTTFMNGSNPQTNSTWNQTSQTIGNTTFHDGTDANGRTWQGTTQTIGGSVYHEATDSDGNYTSCVTTKYFSDC